MPGHILVVDDEPDMRLLLRLTLGRAGFEVTEAATGEEAMTAVEHASFDLVLLDLNLPGIGGLEILDAWNDGGVVPALPVVVLTADARLGLEEETMSRGGRECLRKPIASADLIERIEAAMATPAATVEER
ncbi:MAG TPA: response regulator [Actinomycetota bacterium]|nr:response regulator [Actinomycetota bacterium]